MSRPLNPPVSDCARRSVTSHQNNCLTLFFLLQTQFVAVIIHTTINIMADCSYPKAFNYAVVLYALSLIVLFSNFYIKAYVNKKASHKTIEPEQNGHTATNDSHLTNGVQKRKRLRIDQ